MNKTIMGKLLTITLLLGFGSQGHASCPGGENLAMVEATPSADFMDMGDGLVRHRPTQLVWMRCALGQQWTGSECTGTADLLDWAAALHAAAGHDPAGFADWRLPNRNELASIVETRCHSPAINGDLFPDHPETEFWTSSLVTGQAGNVWVVDFDQGAVTPAPDDQVHAIRLVSGGRM